MKKVLGFLVVVGIAVGMRMWNRDDANKKIEADAKAMITQMPIYEKHAEYLDSTFKLAHSSAFGEAYTTGGRRTPDKFDADKYMAVLLDRMIELSRQRHKQDVVDALVTVRKGFPAADKANGDGK